MCSKGPSRQKAPRYCGCRGYRSRHNRPSFSPLDTQNGAHTIETRFCVTIRVTKTSPRPLGDRDRRHLTSCLRLDAGLSKRCFRCLIRLMRGAHCKDIERGYLTCMEAFEDRYVQNIPFRPAYCQALHALTPILAGLPPRIIAIDGQCNAGKTSLGRFLAYRFNITLLEADFYLCQGAGVYDYDTKEPKRLISQRLNRILPIIVEGVEARRLLKKIGYDPDFVIRVVCRQSVDTSKVAKKLWQKYIEEFPDSNSNYLRLEIDEDPV
jgi:hypothetical protein